MTKDLNKAIMNKVKAKNKFLNWPSSENLFHIKELKINVILWPKKQKEISSKRPQKMEFGRTVKPFLMNNGRISNDFIGIENEGNPICNEQELWGQPNMQQTGTMRAT